MKVSKKYVAEVVQSKLQQVKYLLEKGFDNDEEAQEYISKYLEFLEVEMESALDKLIQHYKDDTTLIEVESDLFKL